MKFKVCTFRITRERLARWLALPLVQRTAVVVLSFLVVYIYAALALNISFLSPVANVMKDFSMTDIYYQISWATVKPDTSRIVTIVDLTDRYDRADIAQCIEDIEAARPKVLAIDALFEGERDDLEANMQLMEAVSSYDNIVCSYVLGDYVGGDVGFSAKSSRHAFFKDHIADICEGYTNMPRNFYGGIKRQVSYAERVDGKLEPSFCLKVCNGYIAPHAPLPMEEKTVDINFAPKEFVVLQPQDVMAHPELITDRVVLFGSMREAADMHYSPIGKIAGVKLLAYAIETILAQNEIRQLPGWAFALLTFCLVFLIRYIEERFCDWTSHHRNPFVNHFVGSSYGVGILVFVITVVLMGVFYGIYSIAHVSISLAITLAASAFLSASQGFYKALQQSISSNKPLNPKQDDEENIMDTVHRDSAMPDDSGATPDGLQDFGDR